MSQTPTSSEHGGVDRRRFLAAIGGGAAAVGLVACDPDGPDGPGTALFDEQHAGEEASTVEGTPTAQVTPTASRHSTTGRIRFSRPWSGSRISRPPAILRSG